MGGLMKLRSIVSGVFCCFFLLCCLQPVVSAENVDESELKRILKEQALLIESLSKRVKVLEEKKYSDVSAVPTSLKDIAPKSTWTERMKIKGDFRYRHEIIRAAGRRHNTTQAERDSRSTTRNRQRIRARVGLFVKINEDIDFAFQIASGSQDPISTNQTLGDFFESKSLRLDLAYLTWHPEYLMGINVKGLETRAGKMKIPFYRPYKSQMIWDDSLRPEGIHAGYKFKVGEIDLAVNGGGFWVDEDSNDVDRNLWGVQGYFKAPVINKDIKLVGGLTYYDYGSIRNHSIYNGDSFGNTSYFKPLNTTELYRYDYNILESFTELHFKIYKMPLCVFGDFASNVAVSANKNAYQVGVAVGKCVKPGSWRFIYDWRRLDSDSILGVFSEASCGGGGTDLKGSRFKVDYQLAKHTRFSSTLYINKNGLEDGDGKQYRRVQFDLKVKF